MLVWIVFYLPNCLLLSLVFLYIYISQGSVEMHLSLMVYITITLIQIVCRVCQWTIFFENWSIIGEDINKSEVPCFSWPTVYLLLCLTGWGFYSRLYMWVLHVETLCMLGKFPFGTKTKHIDFHCILTSDRCCHDVHFETSKSCKILYALNLAEGDLSLDLENGKEGKGGRWERIWGEGEERSRRQWLDAFLMQMGWDMLIH